MTLLSLTVFGDPINDMVDSFKDSTFRVSGPLISSLVIMAIVAILAITIGIMARHHDPMKPSKGLLGIAEFFVDWLEGWTAQTMGRAPGNWPGYFLCLFTYLFLAFIWSITGFPSVIDTLVMPLALSVVMFTIIQFTGLRYQKFKYFHRYVEPIAIFLPVNLITMWTPIISTTLRMFGNCLAGGVIIGLINWAMKNVSVSMINSMTGGSYGLDSWAAIFFGSIPIAVLNLYFALFSGGIQTLVFASLNAVWFGQEMPEDDGMGIEGQTIRAPASKDKQSI